MFGMKEQNPLLRIKTALMIKQAIKGNKLKDLIVTDVVEVFETKINV